MAQHFGINILKPLWTQEVQDGIHILPLREHTFDSPFSLTDTPISKFKAFKRIGIKLNVGSNDYNASNPITRNMLVEAVNRDLSDNMSNGPLEYTKGHYRRGV